MRTAQTPGGLPSFGSRNRWKEMLHIYTHDSVSVVNAVHIITV